jgi:hypothetical protein
MMILDNLAWKLVQATSMFQFVVCSFLLRYCKGIESRATMLGYAISGQILANSKFESLPPSVAMQMLWSGRILLMIFVAGMITTILETVLL